MQTVSSSVPENFGDGYGKFPQMAASVNIKTLLFMSIYTQKNKNKNPITILQYGLAKLLL